jgi:tetratricopeptide (TPR) repeat protein
MNLGLTQEKLGEKSDAIQTYQNVIKQFPDDALAYLRLGTCLAQLKDWDSAMFPSGTGEAIAHLEKSIELDPTNPCAHHNLAWTRLNTITSSQHQQNYHQIVNTYQKAVQLYHQQSRPDLANQIENAFAKVGITLSNISS